MQIKQTHRVILEFLLYSIFRGKYMINKKVFLSILLLSALLFSNPTKAIEENNGYVGFQMYKFPKPRIAKEVTIINVFPNTPAWNAGIRIADRVLKVNDIDVTEYSVEEVQGLIIGRINEEVKLTLKTREGIKDFKIKRAAINKNRLDIYPLWQDFCGDRPSDNEACFIHSNDIVNKKFELGNGPASVSIRGRYIAQKRYSFENNLYLCSQSKDPAMCYVQLKQNLQNQAIANQAMQQQTTQNMIQNFNHLNTNLELQNMNQNLYNINNNLQMLRY